MPDERDGKRRVRNARYPHRPARGRRQALERWAQGDRGWRELEIPSWLYSVTPVFQIAISRSPLTSLRARRPEAVSITRCSNSLAAALGLSSVSTRPASKSIQCGLRAASAVLEEILSVGTGKPNGVPRPVVKSSTVAPAATSAVEET